MRGRVVILAVAGGLLLAPSAFAATVAVVEGATVRVLASGGETNDLLIEDGAATARNERTWVISDSGAPLEAGPGCQAQTTERVVCVAPGANYLFVDAGDRDDTVRAYASLAPVVLGGAGDDTLLGRAGAGADRGGTAQFVGGEGADRLVGGFGWMNRLFGGAGDDSLHGADGTEFNYLCGGEADDPRPQPPSAAMCVLRATGNDMIVGGPGFDNIMGGDGNNRLTGGAGCDIIDGGPGNDIIDAATGDAGHPCEGRPMYEEQITGAGGTDVIGSRDGQPDQVNCSGGPAAVGDTMIDTDPGDTVLLGCPRPNEMLPLLPATARRTDHAVLVRLTCPATAKRACTGRAGLTLMLAAGKAAAAGYRRALALATVRYAIPKARTRTIRFRLTTATRRTLARHSQARARLTVRRESASRSRTIALRRL